MTDSAPFAAQLEAFVRAVVRDEFKKITLEQNRTTTTPPTEKGTGICGLERDGKICLKEHSTGRHKFSPKPHKAPARDWEPITEFRVQGTGSRSYMVQVKGPVKVKGLGRGGAAGDGFHVVSAERNTKTGKVNVSVVKGRGKSPRIVDSSRIVYKRPSASSREST